MFVGCGWWWVGGEGKAGGGNEVVFCMVSARCGHVSMIFLQTELALYRSGAFKAGEGPLPARASAAVKIMSFADAGFELDMDLGMIWA